MKQYKYLYSKMLDKETILKAYKNLRKNKTKRKEIIYIDNHLEEEAEKMRIMIYNTRPSDVATVNPELAYKPQKRTPRTINEHGKLRKIYMPEIHEQWLHHIIALILAPIILNNSYPFSCGSLPKRGAHYGKRRIERLIARGKGIKHCLKCDIRHFYDSIRIDILMRELSIRIKDDWFLYIIRLCLYGFKKGIPLGFYISQWLANYMLEPLDKMIISHRATQLVRYMDDIVIFSGNKKILFNLLEKIKVILGRRFRLKLKRTYQIFRFHYITKQRTIGRCLDFMGFQFFRNKTIMRKSIMIATTRLALRMNKAKNKGRGYYRKHVKAMLSYMGWYSHTDTYNCYLFRIKPYVNIGKLKKISSKLDILERKVDYDKLDNGTMCFAA